MNINVPIIFLTAKDSENDILTGFSLGADDYIPKPFSVNELTARVKAVLKRSRADKIKAPVTIKVWRYRNGYYKEKTDNQ